MDEYIKYQNIIPFHELFEINRMELISKKMLTNTAFLYRMKKEKS